MGTPKLSRVISTCVRASVVLLFLNTSNAKGEVLFSDGFDNSPDWKSAEVYPSTNAIWPRTWKDLPGGPTQAPPKNWTSYRAAKPKRDGHEKTFVLSAEGARTPGGKGMTYNIESIAYGTWVGGGLDVYLGNTGYQDLFVRFYLKYDPKTFHWGTVKPNFALQKLIRISRLEVPLTADVKAQEWGTREDGGRQMPVLFPDVMNNPVYNTAPNYGLHFNYSHRYAPNYFPNDGTSGVNVWSIPMGGTIDRTYVLDGQWHSYEFRVKMNSAPDQADGEWELWVDGGVDPSRHMIKTGIPWVQSGASTKPGWNWLTVLDNSTIQPDSQFANAVMKLFMDDFVASTHYSGPPPAPINVSAHRIDATSVQVRWSAGTGTVPYAVKGYRVHYGTDPINLANTFDAGNVKQADIRNLQAGATYHFAVTAFNKEAYDLAENVSLKSDVVEVDDASSPPPTDPETGDTITPSVTAFVMPATSSTLSVPVSSFTATDNVQVTGYLITESSTKPAASASGWLSSPPASFTFAAQGVRTAYAWAKDAAGHVSSSRSASVTITLPAATGPVISILSPKENSAVPAMTEISASASSSLGIMQMRIYIDNVLKSSVAAASVSYKWDTTTYAKGTHAIMIYAFDNEKNLSTHKFNVITGSSDTTPPSASVVTPLTGTSVSGSVNVTANASDSVGVTKVEFLVNGVVQSSDTSAPYQFAWDTASLANGSYTLSAKAYDAAGNVGTSANVTVNVLNDTAAPVITQFVMPETASSLEVPVSTFVATDDVEVAGYLITESGTPPPASSSAWTTSAPANFKFGGEGDRVAYAWAKDRMGNISAAKSARVLIALPDTVPPVITLVSPAAGSNRITTDGSISANASDKSGIVQMRIYVGNDLVVSVQSSSVAYKWNASKYPVGTYAIQVYAFDGARNLNILKFNVTVEKPASVTNTLPASNTGPVISNISPADGSRVSSYVTIKASASDPNGVKMMQIFVDGSLKKTSSGTTVFWSWNTRTVSSGTHIIEIRAYDKLDNLSVAKVSVTK